MIVYHMIISIAGKIYCCASERERERGERERDKLIVLIKLGIVKFN